MPSVFFHMEYCDMHFVYGFCDGNARAAVQEYQRRFPDRRILSRSVFTRIHQTLRDTGFLLSVSLQSKREVVTHERTFFRWFREVRVCPLVEWPLASAITYAGVANFTWGRFVSLPWSKGTTSGTRRPCSAYGFLQLDKSSSRTVKRHFIQWWGVFYAGQCKYFTKCAYVVPR